MTNKILVSGFDRFGHLKKPNASSEVALPAIKEKYGDLVETLIMPTAREVAAEQLLKAIDEINPAAIVMFGVSAGKKVRLENQAKNVKFNLLIPDNAGVRTIAKVDKQGPRSIESTLPLDDIYARLNEAQVPTKFSDSAGAFICNEVMYKALMHTAKSDSAIPTGFIHFGNGLSDQLVEDAALLVVDTLSQH